MRGLRLSARYCFAALVAGDAVVMKPSEPAGPSMPATARGAVTCPKVSVSAVSASSRDIAGPAALPLLGRRRASASKYAFAVA